jgi:hypothetical protein
MSNGKNMLRLLSEESFLTEQEVRESIRRQILLHESLKNPVLKLILEQEGTGSAAMGEKFKDAGLSGMGAAETARKVSNVFSALAGTAVTYGIMAIPLVPITMKLKAAAFIGASVVTANEIIKEIVSEFVLEEKVKSLFKSNAGGLGSPAIVMGKKLAELLIVTGKLSL